MTVQIPNHAHCVICNRAIEHGEKTCSPEHATELENLTQRRKKSARMMYILMAIAIGFLILQLVVPGMFGG